MAEYSIRVQNRITNSEHVLSSVTSHGKQVAKLIATQFGAMQKEEAFQILSGLQEILATHTKELKQKEQAYVAEQTDDLPERQRRDEAEAQGVAAMARVMHRLDSIKEDGSLSRKYGLPTATPKTPGNLYNTLENACNLLIGADQTYIDPFGVQVSSRKLGEYLQHAAQTLKDALEAVKSEERELQETLLHRDRALDSWARTYQSIATILEGYYRLAGLEELADRIRPTIRQRRGEVTPEQPITDPALALPTEPSRLEEPTG